MIKVYTSKECGYCSELKIKLDDLELEYIDFDVDDKKNEKNVKKLFNLIGEPVIPIIIYGKRVLAPKRSFNSIEQAITLIQSIT